jgi:hypothetical protein
LAYAGVTADESGRWNNKSRVEHNISLITPLAAGFGVGLHLSLDDLRAGRSPARLGSWLPETAMQAVAKYLLILDSAGSMVARLFDAQRRHVAEFDASSEEVTVMIKGLNAQQGADPQDWGLALRGHNPTELAGAMVYTLDV